MPTRQPKLQVFQGMRKQHKNRTLQRQRNQKTNGDKEMTTNCKKCTFRNNCDNKYLHPHDCQKYTPDIFNTVKDDPDFLIIRTSENYTIEYDGYIHSTVENDALLMIVKVGDPYPLAIYVDTKIPREALTRDDIKAYALGGLSGITTDDLLLYVNSCAKVKE